MRCARLTASDREHVAVLRGEADVRQTAAASATSSIADGDDQPGPGARSDPARRRTFVMAVSPLARATCEKARAARGGAGSAVRSSRRTASG